MLKKFLAQIIRRADKKSITNQNCEQFFEKYRSVLTDDQYNKLEDIGLGLLQSFRFSDEEIEQLDKKLKERNEFNNLLSNSADRNNVGIAFEKDGNIDDAIKIYEENIADSYPATHSYERLMIFYRRKKMYTDELRVINRAIEIFTKENERRFNVASTKPENEAIKENLQIGLETCTPIEGVHGWIAYNPFPVIKWIQRTEKVKKLIIKNTH